MKKRFFAFSSTPLLVGLLFGTPLLLSSCHNHQNASASVADAFPGLELQSEDYRDARSHFQTHLVKQMAAPQEGGPLTAPQGALQVVYSPASSLKAWVSPAPKSGGKHPAVLFLHGGFAMGASDWTMTQSYRDAVFVVMMPALRGENGQAGSYSMFYNEVGDALAATTYLSKLPYVDAGRIYVAGHSVGGTLAQLCALTSSRFKAGASFSGAPDPIAWSKDQPEVVPFNTQATQEFQMRSSLAYATSFKCPMRLYYGDEERWCALASQTTADRAKDRGLDVEALSIPGDHFSEVPEAMQQSIIFFQSHP